jgi:uncharacterized membrane protein
MNTIAVFCFDTPEGAQEMLAQVEHLLAEESLRIKDAALVTWPAEKEKPMIEYLNELDSGEGLGAAFWGLLLCRIFIIPSFGMAVGAAMGSLSGKFSDYGIGTSFMNDIADKVVQGTSALFLMADEAEMYKVIQSAKQKELHFEIITTSLSSEQEQQLAHDFRD